MPDEQPVHSTHKGAGILVILWWVAMALVLYVLSVGPVARYYDKRSAPSAVEKFYAPLGAVYGNFPPARTFFDWYAKLWGTHL